MASAGSVCLEWCAWGCGWACLEAWARGVRARCQSYDWASIWVASPPPRRGAAGDLCVCCLHCTGGVLTGFSLECSVILFPLPLSYGFRFCVSEYAQVLRMLGNGRCESACFDSVKRLCHIRGKLRKKVWVNAGDIVLIGLREYQDEKADIILKYTADEARSLKQYGEIPDTTTIHENAEGGEGEDGEEGVVFEFDDIDEI